MNPSSFTSASFTLDGPGAAAIAGTVSYSGLTALFKPASPLAANTRYQATISGNVTSAAGVALAASYTWSATTGATADTTPPLINSTYPASAASGVSLDAGIAVTFSESMDPATLTASTFTLQKGTAAVAGTVTSIGVTATFTPAQPLAANSTYTAAILSAKDLAGNSLGAAYAWSFTTGASAAGAPPTVTSIFPANQAVQIATNSAVSASFSEAMSPASISTTTFKVTSAAGAVAGSVTYAGQTATFQPASALANSTLFTATLTTGAKDLAGVALAAAYVWTFTTGAAADTTPPTVLATSPLSAASAVLTTTSLQASFSEALTAQTISASTFTLVTSGGAAVNGSVSYDAANKRATFQPGTSLAANATYTARIKSGVNGVKDLAGNALAADYVWSFTTGAHAGLSPVLLGSSVKFVVLAKTAISSVPASAVTGDLGLSPAAQSYITGFSLTAATGYATSTQVVGKVYAADDAAPTPTTLTTAVADMQTAYTDAAGRPTPDFLNLNTGNLGGLTLTPGLYKWTSTVTVPGNVTFNGSASDVWILQISGDLTMSAAKSITLSGGALAKNIFWQVAGTVNLGAGAHFEGVILSQTGITLQTAASMNGRALAQTAVALDKATVTQPAP